MRVDISRDPRATHYCVHCGLAMKAREELFCRDRDGDLCEPKKVANLADLKKDHPRVIAARKTQKRTTQKRKPLSASLNAKLDRIVISLIGAVDYDHAKNLDEDTAEEPHAVGAERRRLRSILFDELRLAGLIAFPPKGRV